MQRALRLSLAEADVLSSSTGSARRANRFLVTGAAVVTAGALLAGPTAQNLNLPAQIQHHAVELTGLSAAVTASPIEVYSEILSDTFDNVSALSQAILANPLPILSQVIRNQIGYAQEIGGAIGAIPAGWQTYAEGRGATFLASLQTSLDAGDVGGAVNYLSSFVLYGLQATVLPVLNTLLTYTPRGSTVANPGIPQTIAQNVANAVGVLFSSTVVVSNLFQSVYGTTLSVLASAGDGLAGFAQSVSAGDIQGAVNSLVNLPGLMVNGLLNGWQHPISAAPFPALLTFIPVAPPTDPENGVTRTGTSIGLLGRLLVSIPQAIAAAITPATTTAAASAAPATALAATAEVTEAATSETATAETVSTEPATQAESTEASTSSAAESDSTTTVTKPATSARSAASSTRSDRSTDSDTTSTTSSGDQVKKSVGGSRKAQAKKSTASSGSDSSSSSSSSDSSDSSD
ncbi:hypothetical protein [Mycobacterium sp. M26]|uniref:hypothetical protein n=1 Tax=Mycobacterium sp. M26 TaxID=1762962 RepID=UPI00073F1D5D|nr:hypothetical protein [Mycobacterium sp. M26]